MTNAIVTEDNSLNLVDQINRAVDAGFPITVNGFTPIKHFNTPAARSYQNGTLSIRVKGKTVGKVNDIFFKVGTGVIILESIAA